MEYPKTFEMNCEHYVVNNLALGIACKFLAQMSGTSIAYWMAIISDMANEQCDSLTPEQIQKTVDTYKREVSAEYEDEEPILDDLLETPDLN